MIGGAVTGARNVISGNVNYGIYVSDPGTRNLTVQGNYLGTDPHGTNAIGNGYSGIGIWSAATNVIVGGTNAGAGNLISGNDLGVDIGGAGDDRGPGLRQLHRCFLQWRHRVAEHKHWRLS